ncbi:hypothetical protein X975_15478, partial [Stegodyphus mimosarum]
MNPFNGEEQNMVIEGQTVRLPTLNGGYETLSPSITFRKPCWMPDEEAASCLNCGVKFSQLKRKHHCRNCGKIFCSKCCSEKMCLPHFGLNDPEKVCNNCKLIVELMMKSRSDNMAMKYEAVEGLSTLTKNVAGLCKVIECGGLHIMLSMALNGDTKLKGAVASAVHNITQNMMLNTFLTEIGCLKVLKCIISSSNSTEVLSDCLSALNLLCMDFNIRIKVLKEGMISPLLTIISSTGTIAVFAARILLLLVNNFDHHEFILQNHSSIISDLFDCLQDEDYQMQTCISKMLVFFSAGSSSLRQAIIQEDVNRSFPLTYLLKGAYQNVLLNVICIVANLSLDINENYVHQYVTGLCELLNSLNEESEEMYMHLGRGLANFAENPANTLHMIHHLPSIITNLLKSAFEVPKIHASRVIIYLFSTEPTCTLDVLSQSGMDEFIEIVFNLPGITDILNNLLLRKVSR